MPKNVSFQLYSARNHQPWDKVITTLAKAGYDQVEGFGGAYGSPGAFYDTPERFKELLDKYDLSMTSGHFFPIEMLEKERKRVTQIARTLGMRNIYCPFVMPDQRPKSASGWKAFGKRLGEVGNAMRGEGFGFGWHNHDFEFVKLKDGSTPHERIFEGGPYLDWEIDVAWIVRAKQNPLKWIKSYKDRITAVHVKDIAPTGENTDQDGWCDVGSGTVKWPELFKALRGARVMHYVMEHDNPKNIDTFAKRSIDFVKKH